MERIDVEKENGTVNPADRDVGAANLTVVNATPEPCSSHHVQPLACPGSHADVLSKALSAQAGGLRAGQPGGIELIGPCGLCVEVPVGAPGGPEWRRLCSVSCVRG